MKKKILKLKDVIDVILLKPSAFTMEQAVNIAHEVSRLGIYVEDFNAIGSIGKEELEKVLKELNAK